MLNHAKILLAAVILSLLALAGTTQAAQVSAEHGKLLFSEDFSTLSGWTGKIGDWQVAEGVATGKERPEEHHPAVRRHPLMYHNGIFEFSFRFDASGGAAPEQIALIMNENSQGGHVCLIYLTPTRMYAQAWKQLDGSGEIVTFASLDTPIAPGTWHSAVVEIDGKELSAQVDGKQTIHGESARIDVDKIDFGLLVRGVGSLRDVKVYDLAK